jgi:hypothetical protein
VATDSWIGGSADRQTASDWRTGLVLAGTDDVMIANSGAYPAAFPMGDTQTINSLVLDDAGATLSLRDKLAVSGAIAVDVGPLDVSKVSLIGSSLDVASRTVS